MIIYFSGSSRNLKKNIATYKRIVRNVHALGHNISFDWTDDALLREDDSDMRVVVNDAAKSIERAELLIADASGASSFGVGFEVALALHYKKPVLALVRDGTESSSYASGLQSDLLTIRTYDDKTLEKVVEEFVRENEVKLKDLRFNFVIDRKIYNHLRMRSFRSGKTKAEVVRDLIIEDMKE